MRRLVEIGRCGTAGTIGKAVALYDSSRTLSNKTYLHRLGMKAEKGYGADEHAREHSHTSSAMRAAARKNKRAASRRESVSLSATHAGAKRRQLMVNLMLSPLSASFRSALL